MIRLVIISELISKCINLFPETIDISDGDLRGDDGFYSKNLSNAWDDAEKGVVAGSDIDFMIWSIYKILHRLARKKFQNNGYQMLISEVNIEDISQEYIDVINDADKNS